MKRSGGRAKAWPVLLAGAAALGVAWAFWAPPREVPRGVEPASPPIKVSLPAHETIETVLLPLDLSIDRVAGRIDMALGGGAIEAVGDTLLIMDRLGKIFTYRDKAVAESGMPPLPMEVAEFARSSRFRLSEGTLRAHDLEYDRSGGFLYASYDAYDKSSKDVRFSISRIAISRQPVRWSGTWEIVYQSSPIPLTTYYSGRAAGGKMSISGKYLYFALGDYNLDRITNSPADIAAQNPASPFGKTYRYDLAQKSLTPMSVGHRVPQGLTVTTSGRILETEHGPRGGDELNVISDKANYGWPFVSDGTSYMSYRRWVDIVKLDRARFAEKTTEPAFAWVPAIGVGALFESTRFDRRWDNSIIVGSLKALSLYRLRMIDDRVVFAEPIWIGHRIRDMVEQEGLIVIWADDGSLLFLTVNRRLLAADQLNVEPAYAESSFLRQCSSCHSFSPRNRFSWGPSLKGVFGRKIAGDDFQNYSAALKNKAGVWDEANLTAFLLDPQGFAPGTSMSNLDLTAADVSQLVSDLKARSGR